MINKSDILLQATKSIPKFIEKVNPLSNDFKITNRGVWSSECFALCVMCDYFGVDDYIESGLYRGQSIFNVSKFKSIPCYGFDLELKDVLKTRLKYFFDHGLLFEQDSLTGIPELLEDDLDQEKSGIFIDGPKGWDALKLAQTVIDYVHVKFIGIHDTYLPVDIRDDHYRFRKHLEDNFNTWSTDDPEFVKLYSHLDNVRWVEYMEEEKLGGILPYTKLKSTDNGSQYKAGLLKSYGPTITFIWRK